MSVAKARGTQKSIATARLPKSSSMDLFGAQSEAKDHADQSFPFMSLPPELRHEIYRDFLVYPHRGYLKCHYIQGKHQGKHEGSISVFCDVQTSILRVSRQIAAESTSIFYRENVFALTKKPSMNEINTRIKRGILGFWVDFGQVQKLHITTRHMADYTGSTAERFAQALKWVLPENHNLQYLLVDCVDNLKNAMEFDIRFPPRVRTLGEILSHFRYLSGIKNVHFVSMTPSFFPRLRFLEESMMANEPRYRKNKSYHQDEVFYDPAARDSKVHEAAANDMAKCFGLKPCYDADSVVLDE